MQGERAAVRYLRDKGFKIQDLNYRCSFGEIDIVAREGLDIVFVEVKSRTTPDFGDPETWVTQKKQEKLSRTALHYLNSRRLHDRNARFDVLAITMTPSGNEILHIINAFDLALT